jgi:FkbM family methyltransferase
MNFFLDVGAHNGNTFQHLDARYLGWTIFCIEPSQRHIPTLIEAAKNDKDKYKVIVCPFGLGEFTKSQIFLPKTNPEGDSFFEGYEIDSNLDYSLMAMTYSASEFILNVTKPEDKIHMKLDCEGSEYGILRDLMKNETAFNRIEKLFVEFHRIPGVGDEVREEFALQCAQLGHPVFPWNH